MDDLLLRAAHDCRERKRTRYPAPKTRPTRGEGTSTKSICPRPYEPSFESTAPVRNRKGGKGNEPAMVFNSAIYILRSSCFIFRRDGESSPERSMGRGISPGTPGSFGMKRATGYCRGTHHCCTCNPRNPPKTRPHQNAPPYTPKSAKK